MLRSADITNEINTVPPESTYPFTEVLQQPIRRLTPRSRLGKDAACRNFTEVLPRFAGSILLWVVSTDISTDMSTDMSVDGRSICRSIVDR